MNKESKKNLLKFSKEDLIEIMDYMQETLKYQKQKIDKAIEYIKENEFKASDGENCYFCNMQVIKDLLDILRGTDDDKNI